MVSIDCVSNKDHVVQEYDVIINGAGPAGAAAGFDLAVSGVSVLLLDRRRFPRKKACAGGITPKAMALFPYDISHMVERICREILFRNSAGKMIPIRSGDRAPLCYMTQRQDLDAYALNKSIKAGAEFLKIDQLLSLSQNDNGVNIKVRCGGRQKYFRSRYLIGADGANSKVRELLGLSTWRVARCPALEADVSVDHPEKVKLEFDFSRGIAGYYWVFPKKDHVNIGIYGARSGVPMNRRLLATYARERLGTETLENIKGYPIAAGGGRHSAGTGRVLLTGDAAGFAESLFGEGIYFALKSGRTAAAAIVGNRGGPVLNRYRCDLTRLFVDLKFHRLGAKMLYCFPRFSLGIGGCSPVKGYFAKGIARGRTISQMLTPL